VGRYGGMTETTETTAAPGTSAADAAAQASAADATAARPASATGPTSILTCPACGKRNKIRPSARGTPHCGSCGKPLPWLVEASDDTFDVEANSSVAVLVDLWAPWCGPCRVVGPIVEQLAQEYAGRLKVVKVNVDDNPALARQFRAMSIPTLVVLKDGRVVDRIVGAMPKPDLKMRLFPYLLRT
jgi:thioredoxin 2